VLVREEEPMADRVSNGIILSGKRVAFTGRLASMTRADAVQLVRAQGGEFVPAVSRLTSLLVVGLEGWPLQKDGRLTRKLLQARRLQHYGFPIDILPEEEMLSQIGWKAQSEGIHKLYTTVQLCQILPIPGDRLRVWMAIGLIQPAQNINGVCYFDYQQVTRAKTLSDLAQSGVSAKRLRQSLEQLRKWMPGFDDPLSQLAVIERDGKMLVRLQDGQLAEPTGQLHFDFEEDPPSIAASVRDQKSESDLCLLTSVQERTADEWFDLAQEHETCGRLPEAVHAYRQALLRDGPHPDICFNLGNVLYAFGQKEQAAERYYQALEMDNHFAPAWNNLGNVLFDLGQQKEAVKAFRTAIEINPQLASARQNLSAVQ
jgi:tetratricopeptide (TPR) repeat protein